MTDISFNFMSISPDLRDSATEILALSFQNYPVVQYYFPESIEFEKLQTLYQLCYDWQQAFKWTFTGIMRNDKLVGVACITEPETYPEATLLKAAEQELITIFGENVASRIDKYTQTKAAYLPQVPHFYLDMLAVHPDAQGQGVGKALLNWLCQLSQSHPTSVGVGLDTETTTNVIIYQRCGFQVTATTQVEDVPIWFMFREN